MSPDVPSLEDLVRAICEGTPIDWDALEQVGSDTFRSQVAALKVVAGIARVHRSEATGAAGPARARRMRRSAGGTSTSSITSPAARSATSTARGIPSSIARSRSSSCAVRPMRTPTPTRSCRRADCSPASVIPTSSACTAPRASTAASGSGWSTCAGARSRRRSAEDGALPPRKVAEIGAALCDALAAVHGAGLVHRDVKAQNVMLADDGRVVLMDFGAGGDVRHVGLDMAGTPLYLAPEVARGAPASAQSDIYSLGVLLRYAATGAYSRDVAPSPNGQSAETPV